MICGPIAIKNLTKLVCNTNLDLQHLIDLTNCEEHGTKREDIIRICNMSGINLKEILNTVSYNKYSFIAITKEIITRTAFHAIVVTGCDNEMNKYGHFIIQYTDSQNGEIDIMSEYELQTKLETRFVLDE